MEMSRYVCTSDFLRVLLDLLSDCVQLLAVSQSNSLEANGFLAA